MVKNTSKNMKGIKEYEKKNARIDEPYVQEMSKLLESGN